VSAFDGSILKDNKMTNFSPLSLYFVWHPADEPTVKSLVEFCTTQLQRDVKKPFSRAINLPIFYRTTRQKGVPSPIATLSEKTLIFPFVGKEAAADREWSDYLEGLPATKDCHVVPIAMDEDGLRLDLGKRNFIRSFQFERAYMKEYLLISIAHEIYRYGLNESFDPIGLGKNNALKIFLSHAKDGKHGINVAAALKAFIDNSNMRNFFDATDIAAGYRFDEEIRAHIQGSTLIAIHSDPYSSRYWCQLEVLAAKDLDRPMIAVDCLEEFEDRRFPFASNIPGVHVHPEGDITHKDLLRILSVTILETVRFFYSKQLLLYYKNVGWIGSDAEIRPRPPEVSDVDKILTYDAGSICYKHTTIVYPEPPVYVEELKFLSELGINIHTPLTYNTYVLKGKNIGISVSDPSEEELTAIGQSAFHLVQLSQALARHLLARECTLVYGGDLRENGFTQFIFDEALSLQTRLQTQDIHVENFIAWPIYNNDSIDVKRWKAKYRSVADMIELPLPEDVKGVVPSASVYLPPTNVQNLFVWSRSLTAMREQIIEKCDARICAGGKHANYKGMMPGVLEEVLLALEKERPIYLLGGFGGITATLCQCMLEEVVPQKLTRKWQIANNLGYSDLLRYFAKIAPQFSVDYPAVVSKLKKADLRNGLTKSENETLFTTPFVDEAVHLVLKGLKSIGERASI